MKNVLEGDAKDFTESQNPEALFESPDEGFLDGNVLVKVMPKRKSMVELQRNPGVVTDLTVTPELYDPSYLFDTVTQEIINIQNVPSLKEALEHVSKVHNALGKLFYGAVLTIDNKKINPLHPLTAMSIISNEDHPFHKATNIRVSIFTFQSEKKYNGLHETYKSDKADKDKIEANINNQILAYTGKVDTVIKFVSTNTAQSYGNINLQYKVFKHPDEIEDSEFYLVAHQLLTAGVIMPYYATSIIRMTGNTSGLNITPMVSSNIVWRNEKGNKNPAWNSVCTGSMNNRSLKGLRSLTHSNRLSPYNSNTIQPGSLVFADACNIKSLEIYHQAKYIKDTPNVNTYEKIEEKSTETECDSCSD